MACGGEGKSGGIVEQAEYFHGKCVEVGVEGFLIFRIAQFECLVEFLFEVFLLLGADGDMAEESEVFGEIFLHVIPCVDAARLQKAFAIVAEFFFRYFLIAHVCEGVCGLGIVDGHAAGVVVGCHNDEGFIGMLTVEIEGDGKSLVEVEDLLDGCAAVVAVKGMVDVAAFDHHEEFVGRLFLEVVEACLRDLGQSEGSGYGVDSVADVPFGRSLVVEQEHFFAVDVLDLRWTVDDLHLVVGKALEQVGGLSVLVPDSSESGSGHKFVAAFSHLAADLVVHGTVGHMCVECTGGGVIGCSHLNTSPTLYPEVKGVEIIFVS